MADKLALLICSASAERADLAVTPLVHALAACALDAEVEIHFAGPAVRWLVPAVAAAGFAAAPGEKSVADFLREALAAGVRVYACGMARAAWIAPEESLFPEVGAAGATAFVARALDPAWRTLTY